ncbi:MAG: hypothetical protein JWO41_622 [Candidatus Saccharibacteria bacterium]|nr:hypothetical protein [Candidatus Saccharibacteria bacterium]
MSELQKRYAELMAPAFVAGLDQLQQSSPEGLEPTVRLYLCQLPIRAALDDIAWEEAGLPDNARVNNMGEIGNDAASPREYARRLLSFAFDDAHKIIKYGAEYLEEQGIANQAQISELLINGKRSLLQASLLTDKSKTDLFLLLQYPELKGSAVNIPDIQQPFQLEGKGESQHLAWSHEVVDWMQPRLGPGQGCPAYGMQVESASGDQRLIYYFWDTLVQAAYCVQQ